MTTPPPALRATLRPGGEGVLKTRTMTLPFAALATGNPLSVQFAALDGAHVLLRTKEQSTAALALIALDGIAARIVIAPPDLKEAHLRDVIRIAQIDTLVSDDGAIAGLRAVEVSSDLRPSGIIPPVRASEWVLFTSGTTGMPRMAVHTLSALTDAIRPAATPATWGTFYDIRRFGGLQILLRAVLGDASLILSDADESVADFLVRLGEGGVSHLTGTPSHWRRALMGSMIARIRPCYVRLSGEIADQALLDRLRNRFPEAAVGHAYASTEAGVGFEVTDGLEGFPASFVGGAGPVTMRVSDGVLKIRSARMAVRFLGDAGQSEGDGVEDRTWKCDGFVDTGDMVERHGDRYYFVGRRGGIINVGGFKVHPEEVEAVINRHPAVRLSRVSGRNNPITGAIVMAEIVVDHETAYDAVRDEILRNCRTHLKPHQVPAMVRIVPALPLSAGGKLARHA